MDEKHLRQCESRLEKYLVDLLEPVGRVERRYWGAMYVRGLLLDGTRKSVEPMARRLPDGDVQAMQQFVGQSPWDPVPVRRRLAEQVARDLIPACTWIVEDTTFPKRGTHSIGVARQYSGTPGKVTNCQVAVSLQLATDDGCMPLNFALYLPEEWTSNPKRLREAGVPEGTRFKNKWELALDLVDEASDWDIPKGVLVCGLAYGRVNEFRQGLLNRKLSYVAEIEANTIVLDRRSAEKERRARLRGRRGTGELRTLEVTNFARFLPRWEWKEIRWKEASRGHLFSRFSATPVQPADGCRSRDSLPPRQWLLAEWPFLEKEPTKFWFCSFAHQAGLRRLVRLAKIRSQVEQAHQRQKDDLGLDHYEGRGYRGWHHHVTMNMVAYGFLLLETLRSRKNFWVDPAEDPLG